jgi:ubiquinone/menaquinone biosynthesis C-methylase UbiE
MITAEDVDGNLLNTLLKVVPVHAKRLLDLGSGTGRIPLLVNGLASQVVALDLQLAMLRENQVLRNATGGHWGLVQADMRFLPVPAAWAEVTIAGWAIGHMRSWFAYNWQEQIGRALDEMERVTAASGYLVIFETLGTGSLEPAPPAVQLAEYYSWLEGHWGFNRHTFPTDYQFSDVDQAVAYTEFFFGSQLAASIRAHGWSRLPEWTGMWVRQVG